MTKDETEDFLAKMGDMVGNGELPDIESLTKDQKTLLLWACRLIDTPEKRGAAAFILSQMKDRNKDYRAFSMIMTLARSGVTIRDFLTLLWSVPGMIVVALIYLWAGGDKQVILDYIASLFP